MLKRTITYEDFNDNQITEDFYFNMSKSELVELEVSYEKGFGETLQAIIEAKDHKQLITEFKKLILMAYGVKSPDGKRFIKNDELREEFSQTAAYNALFMELATDENAAASFIQAVIPKDMAAQIVVAESTSAAPVQDSPALPPPPPETPLVGIKP
jgi:hypothetical protein